MLKRRMSVYRLHPTWKLRSILRIIMILLANITIGYQKIDFEWAVKLHQYSLDLIGLWPKSEQTAGEKRMCNIRIFLVLLAILLVLIIPAIHSVIRIHSDITLVIDNLQWTLPVSTCCLRIVIFWWKKEAITSIVEMVANDWVKTKIPQERNMMIVRAQTARILVTFGYCIMMSGWIVTIIFPAIGISVRHVTNITDPGRPLPLQTYYIYDTTKSPQYELTFTSQAIVTFVCIMPYTGIDNFLSLLVFHICGQLDILSSRLIRLDEYANYTDVLKNCVINHARLLRAVDVIEDTFSAMLFILFLYFGTLFAFQGFLMMSMLEDGYHISISYLAYLMSIVVNMLGHMCMYCAVGELLTVQCDQIHYAIYANGWYTLDPKNARNLILLMIRTNKPLYLNVGHLFPLSMATFCNLLKTSAGYISVLLTTRNQSKI